MGSMRSASVDALVPEGKAVLEHLRPPPANAMWPVPSALGWKPLFGGLVREPSQSRSALRPEFEEGPHAGLH
jgi:hypothetical protein